MELTCFNRFACLLRSFLESLRDLPLPIGVGGPGAELPNSICRSHQNCGKKDPRIWLIPGGAGPGPGGVGPGPGTGWGPGPGTGFGLGSSSEELLDSLSLDPPLACRPKPRPANLDLLLGLLRMCGLGLLFLAPLNLASLLSFPYLSSAFEILCPNLFLLSIVIKLIFTHLLTQ